MKSITAPILNSLLFVRDSKLEDLPDINGLGAFWATRSCIAVSCLPDSDGSTTITIGCGSEVGRPHAPLVDMKIQTPSRTVIVENVVGERILETGVPAEDTRVRVWTNGHRATDIVAIGLD